MASDSDPSILAYDVLRDNKPKSRSANQPGILSDIPMYSEINQSGVPRSENMAFDNQVYSAGSTGTEENMYSKLSTTTVAVQDPPRENKVKSSHEKNWQSDKKFVCILVTIAFLIVAVVVALAVAIISFVELSQLQTSIRSAKTRKCSSIQQLTDELENLGLLPSHPAPSCATILQFARFSISGHYWIRSSNGSAVHMYCDLQNHTAFQEALDDIRSSIQMIETRFSQDLSAIENQTMAILQNYPIASCAVILQFAPSSPSGHYLIRSSNGSAVRVYCDMTRSCGNITGGWVRVVELDMRDNSSSQCPSDLRMGTACNTTRTCVIKSGNANCSSVFFTTHGLDYSRVCGMIRAYQFGTPDAFGNHGDPRLRNSSTLDSNYVDGISLTHGVPQRQHIWTFAAEAGLFG